jgi:transposase
MTKYREIIRLHCQGYSKRNIALSVPCSRNTVARVADRADELQLKWPLPENTTDAVLEMLLFPRATVNTTERRLPDMQYVRTELQKNGVTKKLLWTEYLEQCRQADEEPLMYSQFCHYILEDEKKRKASMHIKRKPGEQVEVDWAGDPAHIIDPDTGELTEVYLFVGVMSYSQYAFVEGFLNEATSCWITAHVHMFQFFGGVPKILVPDNCKTAVLHTKGWDEQIITESYRELSEHYGTAIIPARVRKPKDKPNAESSVGNISTWITAALRNEQFFSLTELNAAIRERLSKYNAAKFQKKDGSRLQLFREDEFPLLSPLPVLPFELASWKEATVQFNYHISFESMWYSVPYEYIGKKVNLRITEKMVEIFYDQTRIASHCRLHGRKGQYDTIVEHMPEDHQKYLEWNGDRFRKWAKQVGSNTYLTVDAMLTASRVEQQAYRGCMGLLKLADKYSVERLEAACEKALSYTAAPSYKSIKDILTAGKDKAKSEEPSESAHNQYGITRGADYYRR